MSKKLYLLRHARAFEKAADQKDTERELDSTGLQNATRMGIHLAEQQTPIDIIISSPAARALSTATLIAEQLHYDPARIHKNDSIYEASVRTLLQVINQFKNEWSHVLLVGHNPSITYLAEYLSKHDIGTMTTCGFVALTLDNDHWEEASEGTAGFESYVYPDLLNF